MYVNMCVDKHCNIMKCIRIITRFIVTKSHRKPDIIIIINRCGVTNICYVSHLERFLFLWLLKKSRNCSYVCFCSFSIAKISLVGEFHSLNILFMMFFTSGLFLKSTTSWVREYVICCCLDAVDNISVDGTDILHAVVFWVVRLIVIFGRILDLILCYDVPVKVQVYVLQ